MAGGKSKALNIFQYCSQKMGKMRKMSLSHTKDLSSPAADSYGKVLEDPFEKRVILYSYSLWQSIV